MKVIIFSKVTLTIIIQFELMFKGDATFGEGKIYSFKFNCHAQVITFD